MQLSKLAFLLLLPAQQVFAQSRNTASSFIDSSRMQAIRYYHAATGNNARVYKGLLRQNYPQQTEGRPYFDTTVYVPADVVFHELQYEHIPVLYDMFTQTLITLTPANFGVQLLPDKTAAFDIGHHHFIRIDSANTILPQAPPGFYEVLISNRHLAAYAFRKVIIEEKITDVVEQKFVRADKYFLVRNNHAEAFYTWRGLYKSLGLSRRSVRRQLDAEGINPKTDPDAAIRTLLHFYSALNPARP
ncbi:MAG: hypothetical protein QM664_12710 [Flavihumibacter sp.]